ncbi:Ig-like domain-containing protein, partial [Algibacter lectus]
YTTTPDAVISQNVLVNDNDVEGDNQTVTANTSPNNGTVTVAPNGDFTYTPNPGFAGTDMFTYTICDDNAEQACDTATVYITVGGIENTTDAIADINNTFVGQPVTGNVLTNDEDFEGDNQSVTANTQPTNGSVVVNSDGTYTYTPNPDFTGEDTFEYTICDDGNPQACDTATVYIEVLPVSGPDNEAPIANADTTTTPEGTPISIPVIANDFDPDGDAISVTETTTPDNGTVTLNPDGTITYTPNDGFIGEDTFTYTICDDANPALCDTATVTVTIQPTDSPNTTNANDDAFFASTCGSLTGNVFVNDNDIEGDTQTITTTTVITTEGVTVIIDANTGEFTYTPISLDFIGNDSFVYSICDNNADQACDQATVYLSITDSTPPSIINCSINDETIECAGDDNESLANTWNDANIAALELCATDACDSTFSGQVTSDYDFDNLVSTCGASGTITVIYTIADANNNTTELVATLTIADTIAPTPTTDIEESLLVNCESVPEVPTIEFTDNCSSSVNVVFEETNSFDESNPSDYEIVRTWTVNDDCDNIATYTQTISVTLNDFITTVNERACSDDGTIDLNDYLENDQVGGTWTITQGNANLDESTFNPENVELGNYIFSYTNANNGCLNTTEVVIEIHDECIVLPCGKDDVVISKVVTPNGDAQNEFFTITGVETCGFVVDLKIFNRWGAKIYENSNYQNNWNGTSHKSSVGGADKVPNGTYYYIINLKNSGLAPIAKAFYVGSK